jgi:hypothetical protein
MQIAINIPDELAATIQASGLEVEKYVESLIAEKAAAPRRRSLGGELTLEEFNASLDRLARYSEKIPSLPDEAFSRENMYSDHD